MNRSYNKSRNSFGFSLAEVLAALTIGSMILIAVMSVYTRAKRSADAVTHKLNNYRLPNEILQRIAEDLDKMITPGSDASITIENTIDQSGYQNARLKISKNIFDGKNKPLTFKEIIWQTSYDYESDTAGLVLYRSHTGIASEDKWLDESRASWENDYSFVPVCTGVTYFQIQVPVEEEFRDQWKQESLPEGVVVTISFAEPFKAITGALDVFEEDKITRTIAVDRTRKINFEIVEIEDVNDQQEQQDQNDLQEQTEQEDANSPEIE